MENIESRDVTRYPAKLLAALAKAQTEIFNPCKSRTVTVAGREGRSGFSYDYAELNVIAEIIRLPLAKNGMTCIQTVVPGEKCQQVCTILGHESGEVLEFFYPIVMSESRQGMKADQNFASAYTYAKRQALKGIFLISDDSEDHDGHDDDGGSQFSRKGKGDKNKGNQRPPAAIPTKDGRPAPLPPKEAQKNPLKDERPVPLPTDPISADDLKNLSKTMRTAGWTPEQMREFSSKAFGIESAQDLTQENLGVLKTAMTMSFDEALFMMSPEPTFDDTTAQQMPNP